MRLEQQITVRLNQADFTQLRSRHTLTVACACGQHINLAWDGQAPQAAGAEPRQFSPRVLARMRKAAATARVALAKKRAADAKKKARAKKLRAVSTTRRRLLTAQALNKTVTRTEPCSVCGKFFTKAGLTMHILRAHRGVGPQKGQPLVRKTATAHAPAVGTA